MTAFCETRRFQGKRGQLSRCWAECRAECFTKSEYPRAFCLLGRELCKMVNRPQALCCRPGRVLRMAWLAPSRA